MASVKRCDLCGSIFETHNSYRPVNLPWFGSTDETNSWDGSVAGSHNASDYDLCVNCFEKLVKYLRKLSKGNR